ncbi:MAG: phage terminase large subunit [Methylorubrum rhodinum]|uniref:phage terminase large subunit n=1 Tax=Methylorubrum rhodinum TaxID=29428 RepID=UPI003BB094F6
MPHPDRINPATGKRYGFVPPKRPPTTAEQLREARAQVRLIERTKLAAEARDSFMTFVRFTQPDPADPDDPTRSLYDNQRHHDAIAAVVEEVEGGRMPFLILTIPPRHGKSELTSRRFPAWAIGRNPKRQIVVAAYNDEFALDFGAEVRSIMKTPQYRQVFPGVALQRGGTAKDRLQTTEGGMLVFVGRGGALTGRGADFLIIDDILKDADEARSPTIREQAWQWFVKVAMTRRMNQNSPVVIIMQRWHEDDLVGRLTDRDNPNFDPELAKKFKIINLPAIAEDDDPLGRAPGEPLWPVSKGQPKFGIEFLEQQRRLDPSGFPALYQQQPTAVDGVLFMREDIRTYLSADLPKDLTWYATSDHAVGTDRTRHDASCLLVGGLARNGDLYIHPDCVWGRFATDRIVEEMLRLGRTHNPVVWGAEKGHISKSIGPFLRKRMEETGSFFPIREITPVQNKEQRAQAIIGRVAQGKVLLPRDAPWVQRAIDEMLKFPNGRNDDFVDALAYFGIMLQAMFKPGPSADERRAKEPPTGSWGWIKKQMSLQEREARRAAGGGY